MKITLRTEIVDQIPNNLKSETIIVMFKLIEIANRNSGIVPIQDYRELNINPEIEKVLTTYRIPRIQKKFLTIKGNCVELDFWDIDHRVYSEKFKKKQVQTQKKYRNNKKKNIFLTQYIDIVLEKNPDIDVSSLRNKKAKELTRNLISEIENTEYLTKWLDGLRSGQIDIPKNLTSALNVTWITNAQKLLECNLQTKVGIHKAITEIEQKNDYSAKGLVIRYLRWYVSRYKNLPNNYLVTFNDQYYPVIKNINTILKTEDQRKKFIDYRTKNADKYLINKLIEDGYCTSIIHMDTMESVINKNSEYFEKMNAVSFFSKKAMSYFLTKGTPDEHRSII